jgi:hypothetical protein
VEGESSLVEVLKDQPELFAVAELEQLERVEAAAKLYVHSGKIVGKDVEFVARLAEMVLRGISERRIARSLGCSRNVIKPVMRELEAAGKLEPYKQRLSKRLGDIASQSIDAIEEAIEAGTMPAQCLPVVMGVALDKKAALDGDGTVVTVRHEKVLSVEDLRAMAEELRFKEAKRIQEKGA